MERNVNELIRDAKNGDQYAFSLLKDRYKPLIESCSYRFTYDDMTEQDKEDVAQEALVFFCNSVCSYNTECEGVEFGLYAKICIENGLVSFLRFYRRRNRLRAISLDGECDIIDKGMQTDLLQSVVDRERIAVLVRQINKSLSKYENKIWWMYVSGMSVSEISKEISADRKSVSNAIYRIRKKLKEALKPSR